MTTRVPIRYGGTGANTAEAARQALDVLSTSGGTFTSNLNVNSVLTANGRGVFGTGFDAHAVDKDIDVGSIVVGGIKDSNGPAEFLLVNKSNGVLSYAEFIALNDKANQSQGWISVGINSSDYNDPTYTLTGPDDGYLLFEPPEGTTANGDLVIGTGSYGEENRIVLAAGGFEPKDAQLVIAPANLKSADIVNSSLNLNIAILTTSETHNFVANDVIVISSVGAPYDGTRTIIDVTSNTINVSITSANVASAVVDPSGEALEFLPFNKGTVELTAQLYVGEDSRSTIETADITVAQGHAIPLGIVVNNDGPGQTVMFNKSNGALAYSEFIAHNDAGNVEMGWISIGINSSGYDDPEYPITKADDGYILYEPPVGTTGDGDLIIGTGVNGTKNRLILAAEGFDEANAQMIITPNESVRIAIDTDASSVNTGALQVVGGVGVQGSMYVQGNQTIQGDLIVNGSQIIQSIENLAAAGPISLLSDGNIANTWDQGLVGTYAVSKASATSNVAFKELANNSATISTDASHTFIVEDIVAIANVDATFDGTHRITGVTANTFSFYKLANTVSKTAATGTATVDKATRYTGVVKRASDGAWRVFSNLGTRPTFNTDFADANLVYDSIVAGAGDFRGTLKLGSPNTATIVYSDANNRTLTIPTLSGDRTFAFLEQSQTFTAAQAFNNTLTATKFIPTAGDATGNGLYLPSANKLALSADGVERVSISASEMVVNDGSNDYDFRVESDDVAHMLFVDGGTNTVGIGTNAPAATLHVQGSGFVSGNVGIGTTNPGSRLHILDSSGPVLRMVRTSNRFDIEADNNAMGFVSRDSGNANAYFSGFNGVGIGTTSPSTKFDVVKSSTEADMLIWNPSASLNDRAALYFSAAAGTPLSRAAAIKAIIGASNNHDLTFFTNPDFAVPAERMRITSAGNVGIGTTNPIVGLEIFLADAQVRLRGTGTTSETRLIPNWAGSDLGAVGTVSSSPFMLFTTNSERMRITSGGNVGIGVTNPAALLHLAGPPIFTSNGSSRVAYFRQEGTDVGNILQFQDQNATNVWEITARNNRFYVYNNALNTYAFTIDASTDNIGIGTLNGGVSLDVGAKTDAIRLPNGTTAQRPGTPAAGQIRFNTTLGWTEVYSGTAWHPIYNPPMINNIEYVMVAGGGAGGGHGGNDGSGGGGAGGYLSGTLSSVASGTSYSFSIGAGGAGVNGATRGTKGGNTTGFNLTAVGGGGGGTEGATADRSGQDGGSGGGAGGYGTTHVGGLGTSGQGNKGGDNAFGSPQNLGGGGGGGATAAGQNGSDGNPGTKGDGGAGATSTITGSSVTYAGGGGCGGGYGGTGGAGGSGGGGSGASAISAGQAVSGTANRGGGGGGAAGSNYAGAYVSGAGGSGVVIFKVLDSVALIFGAGLTYSVNTTAVPGFKVVTITAGAGTITFS